MGRHYVTRREFNLVRQRMMALEEATLAILRASVGVDRLEGCDRAELLQAVLEHGGTVVRAVEHRSAAPILELVEQARAARRGGSR